MKKNLARGIGDYAVAMAILIEVGSVYGGLKIASAFGLIHTNSAKTEASAHQK